MIEQDSRLSLYDRIGFFGLVYIVWKSTPLPLRLTLPYGLKVYRDILRGSNTLEDLFHAHTDAYYRSGLFRVLRPRHRYAKPIIKEMLQ